MADDRSPPDGNDSQVRLVAKQIFDVWERDHDAKTSRMHGSIPAWIACVISVGLLIWNAAVLSGGVSDNRARIAQIEMNERSRSESDREVVQRMTRIETKVDLLLEKRR